MYCAQNRLLYGRRAAEPVSFGAPRIPSTAIRACPYRWTTYSCRYWPQCEGLPYVTEQGSRWATSWVRCKRVHRSRATRRRDADWRAADRTAQRPSRCTSQFRSVRYRATEPRNEDVAKGWAHRCRNRRHSGWCCTTTPLWQRVWAGAISGSCGLRTLGVLVRRTCG